jgi:hypothetical protein
LPREIGSQAARIERKLLRAHGAANVRVDQLLQNAAAAHEFFLVEPDNGMNASNALRHFLVFMRGGAKAGEGKKILDLARLQVREFLTRKHFEDAAGFGQAAQLLVEAVHHVGRVLVQRANQRFHF